MNVIFKQSVLAQVLEAADSASSSGRAIDRIELTVDEAKEAWRDVISAAAPPVPKPRLEPGASFHLYGVRCVVI